MKLKKIASLMLAGVMAVSMLAGCSTASNGNNNNGEGEGEGTTASGYSAMLAKELKDTAAKDYVTFQDNTDDEAALKAMLGGFSNSDMITFGQSAGAAKYVSSTDLGTVGVADIEDGADLDGYVSTITFDAQKKMVGTWKVGLIYAANGTVDMNSVIKAVAAAIDDDALVSELVDKGSSADDVVDVKYSYVVSASVVNVKGTENLQMNQSTNYVLVTVTRTGVTA